MSEMLSAAIEGFLLGSSLIIAIGAQNAFVLRQGLVGREVGAVVAVCILSDAVLISLGAAGVGGLVNASSGLFGAIAIAGALFLAWYGVGAFRRALRPGRLVAAEEVPSGRAAVTTALLLTWANPHVYLDTVVMLGGISGRYALSPRVLFALGAMSASCAWFLALGYGARLLQPVFAKPTAWRILDGLIALVMWSIALGLLVEGLGSV